MFVLGELDPTFVVFTWDTKVGRFVELARHGVVYPGLGWSTGDLLVNREGQIFVSVRHEFNDTGYISKYEYNHHGGGGQQEFFEVARSEVGDFPTRISFSQDEQRVVVCNTGSRMVEVLDAHGLGRLGRFHTGKMYPLFAHEIRADAPLYTAPEEDVSEVLNEEEVSEIVKYFLGRW